MGVELESDTSGLRQGCRLGAGEGEAEAVRSSYSGGGSKSMCGIGRGGVLMRTRNNRQQH